MTLLALAPAAALVLVMTAAAVAVLVRPTWLEPVPAPDLTPRAGTIGVTPSRRFVAWAIRVLTRCPQAAHAFVATGKGDEIIEGDPHGARRSHARYYPRVVWLEDLAAGLSDAQRAEVVAWAVSRLGTPYSWLDDLEIGLVDVFGWAPAFLRRRLRSDRTLMCSQLCDAAYRAAGVELFADGRPAGGVSPADLYRLNERTAAPWRTSTP